MIRLEHLETHRNLHSHKVSSPLTRKNEVSGYGDDGDGDGGDNWVVECLDATTGLVNIAQDDIFGN